MPSSNYTLTNADIDTALARGDFYCVFQPQICLTSGKVLGTEALARWQHPDHGDMPRGLFLSYLQRQGRMQELTQHVFNQTLAAASRWHKQGECWLAHVNLSADDLNFPGLAQALEINLRRHNLPAGAIRLELSEKDMGLLNAQAKERLIRLIDLGFTLAVQGPAPVPMREDDLLPIAEFQLRGTALLGLAEALSLTRSGRLLGILRAAKRLGRQTTAIGLEKMLDVQTAKALGFDAATGFSLARPMPIDELMVWAQNRRLAQTANAEQSELQDDNAQSA